MIKRITNVLLVCLLGVTSSAQTWGKLARSGWRALGETSVSAGKFSVKGLERAVGRGTIQAAAQTAAQTATQTAAQTATQTALPSSVIKGQIQTGLNAALEASAPMQMLFKDPGIFSRSTLLQNKFLTLAFEQGERFSPEQAQLALKAYRLDLGRRVQDFALFTEIKTVSQLAQDGPSLGASSLFVALSDLSGLGFLGTLQDSKLILDVYHAAAPTVLEPVVFTAAARSLLLLKDYQTLETLISLAKPSEAVEQMCLFIEQDKLPLLLPSPVKKGRAISYQSLRPLAEKISPFVSRHLDISAQGTREWLSLARPVAEKEAVSLSRPISDLMPSLETPEHLRLASYTMPPEGAFPSAEVSSSAGILYSGFPLMELGKWTQKLFSRSQTSPTPTVPVAEETGPVVPVLNEVPHMGLISRQYPSGLKDEATLVRDWLEYFKNGYFRPRDQVEAIEGMSASKANNVIEYLYYMEMPEAKRLILNPIRETGRLPDFMYDDRLITGTQRLPAKYYKNKFNENVSRLIALAEEDGSLFVHNAELKNLVTSMADYTFEQGFSYANSSLLTSGLRRKWKEFVAEIRQDELGKINRAKVIALWQAPVEITDGKTVSLKEYFSQTRSTAFFSAKQPEFFLNSPKWVALENERRNLAAQDFIQKNEAQVSYSIWERIQNRLWLGNSSNYLTLQQFGDLMRAQYEATFGSAHDEALGKNAFSGPLSEISGYIPSSLTVKINNFDKPGGVCQMSFSDGGYAGPVPAGYDGTSTVHRFEPVTFHKVEVVTFDFETLQPRVVEIETIPYLKDLKSPDLDQIRASTMVGDGLDPTRDLLSVKKAEAVLRNIPHLKATLYPHPRLMEGQEVPFLTGGGLGGYLALFTPPFYPLKKIVRLRWKDGKLQFVPEYFVRKEILTLAGFIHRDHLTFTHQVKGRETPGKEVVAP